jgi:two-component system, NarL family, nitrate/nitrite response regulator NarL
MSSNMIQVITILLCRNSMLCEGLKHILSDTRYDVCSDGTAHLDRNETSQDRFTEAPPVLFIVDVNYHQGATAEVVRNMKVQHPKARVVVLADGFDLDSMMAVLQAGSDGYCLSTISCEVLVKYLDLVMLGETVFPSAMFLSSLSEFDKITHVEQATPPELPENPIPISAGSPVRTLSTREAEILHCLMQGAPNKIIARKLEVAEATVKVHIKAILRKIRVANRTQAAMWAVAHLPATSVEESFVSSQ